MDTTPVPETITLTTGRDETSQVAVGDFLSEPLVTDTLVWEVVKVTPRTITVRSTAEGEVVTNDHRDGNPLPVTYTEAVSDPHGRTRTLRVRRDGTVRMGTHRGARPMYPTPTRGGVPVRRVDYRY